MTAEFNPELDLEVTRVIAASPESVWQAWADPARFEQWWVPAPAVVRVIAMDLVPGGAFLTEFSEDGVEFAPQIAGSFLAVDPGERIVWTTALLAGWRPAADPFITGIITMEPHADGTFYRARALHRDPAQRQLHLDVGYYDGWGTVTEQLARLVEAG